jgi:hypothetical protein
MTVKIYKRDNRTGGTSIDLDFIDGASLNNKDLAAVFNGGWYFLDATSGATPNGTTIIAPLTNAGTKRWISQTIQGAAPLLSPTFTGTPSAPTPGNTDNSTKLATTSFVKNVFPASGATSGYQKFASGIVMQWGSVTCSATPGAPVAVPFPLSFTAIYSITVGGITSNTNNAAAWYDTPTITGFNMHGALANQGANYIAIGYITPS